MRRVPTLVRRVFGAAAAVLALLLTLQQLGWLPGQGKNDPLGSAASKAQDAGSSRLDLARTIRVSDNVTSEQAQGAFDYRAGVGELEYTNGQRIVILSPYVYELGVSSKPVWCEFDLSSLGVGGFIFGAVTGFENDPGAALVNLEEMGSYEKVGKQVLFNVETTHYAGRVDLGRLAESKGPRVRAVLRRFVAVNGPTLPVDVWLTSDDVVRRIHTSLVLPTGQSGANARAHVDGTYDFSDFGTKVNVPRPAPAKIAQPGKKGCPQRL
jgi:hypothetical protein